jgi:NNP family nitrate/nitrite transporter-like MFS transporter
MRISTFERGELISLLFLTALFYLNFTARVLPSPLGPVFEDAFGISNAGSGLLFLLISAGFLAGMLGALLLAGRATHRRVIIGSTFLLGLALVGTSCATSLWQLQFGMLAIGLTTGVYLPSALPTLTDLIQPPHWGKAIGIHELAPSLAFISVPALAELALAGHSWRSTFQATGLAVFVLIILYSRYGKGGTFPAPRLRLKGCRKILGTPRFWILFLLFCLGISGTIGTYSMLTLFLVKAHGIERPFANTLLSLSRVTTLGTILLGGWGADRLGSRRMMGTALLGTGLVTALLGLSSGMWLYLFFFIQPMLAVCFFPAAYSALSASVDAESRQLAISLTLPGAFLVGAGAIPAGIGVLGDAGLFNLGFICAGSLMAGGGVLCLLLPRLAPDKVPEGPGNNRVGSTCLQEPEEA